MIELMQHHTALIHATLRSPLQASAAIRQHGRLWLLLAVLGMLAGCASQPPSGRQPGPWNFNALSQPPAVQWGATNGLVQELIYENEPWGPPA